MFNRLKSKRENKNYSQTYMAKQLNIAISTYNMYENENRRIPLKIAVDICKILDCKVEDLFYPATFTIRK